MNEAFRLKSYYHNLGNFNQVEIYIRKTKSSLNSCVLRTIQLWQLVPQEVRKSMSLTQVKSKVSKWLCHECPCHLCKQCIKNVGYITKIDFSVTTCRFINYIFLISRTVLAIVKTVLDRK